METLEPAAPGQRIELRLTVPDWSTIDVTGEVVYTTPPMGYGVRFVGLSQATELILQAATESLLGSEL